MDFNLSTSEIKNNLLNSMGDFKLTLIQPIDTAHYKSLDDNGTQVLSQEPIVVYTNKDKTIGYSINLDWDHQGAVVTVWKLKPDETTDFYDILPGTTMQKQEEIFSKPLEVDNFFDACDFLKELLSPQSSHDKSLKW